MKSKLGLLSVIALICTLTTNAQYKNLEGVFFKKVIGFGVGGAYHSFKDKTFGSGTSITPLNYTVLMNDKNILSMQFGIHQKKMVRDIHNDGSETYTTERQRKFFEFETAYKRAVTPGGISKPTSVFATVSGGFAFKRERGMDSRYGEEYDETTSLMFFGAGVSVFQRIGSRFVVFAEPSYRFDVTGAADSYLYSTDYLKVIPAFTQFRAQLGVMILIGKNDN